MSGQEELQQFRDNEAANAAVRLEYLDKLINDLDAADRSQMEMKKELARSKKLIDSYEQEVEEKTREVGEYKRKISLDPFILVLVDGDNALFRDDYVRRGKLGGADAAKALHSAAQTYAESVAGYAPHWKILIRVYVKMGGLARTYVNAGLLPNEIMFRYFVEGFNAPFELCELVDAGSDKQGADNIIQGNFSLFINNVHCRHIMLACSGDGGYTAPLRKYTLSDSRSERITLIRALPFTADLARIADNFHVTDFGDLFRSSKLVTPDPSTVSTPVVVATFASTAASNMPMKLSSPSVFPLVNRQQNVLESKHHDAAVTNQSSLSKKSSTKTISINFNKDGHRVDSQLGPYDGAKLNSLKAQKLCNRHFLTRCPGQCGHSHVAVLDRSQLDMLERIARLSPCGRTDCTDPLCLMGHHCPHDGEGNGNGSSNCQYGVKCKFGAKMHNVDTRVYRTQGFSVHGVGLFE